MQFYLYKPKENNNINDSHILVHISEFLFKIQTVAIHHHCGRVSLLVCRRVLLSVCYYVLGLLSLKCDFKISFLSLSPFSAYRYLVFAVFLFDFSLFLHFKIFLCVIFPLFLLFSFKPITRQIWPAKPKNWDKRFQPTIQSTTSKKCVHPTWASWVTIWPQTRFDPTHGQPYFDDSLRHKRFDISHIITMSNLWVAPRWGQ